MDIQPQFPPARRDDCLRNSEAEVYELEAAPEAPELDFGIWFEDRACFGVQVKGGRYSVGRTVWALQPSTGRKTCLPSHPDVGRRHRRPGCGVPRPGLQGLHHPGASLNRHPAGPTHR